MIHTHRIPFLIHQGRSIDNVVREMTAMRDRMGLVRRVQVKKDPGTIAGIRSSLNDAFQRFDVSPRRSPPVV
jgi:hypothetical protein